jgi:hypothetical protein
MLLQNAANNQPSRRSPSKDGQNSQLFLRDGSIKNGFLPKTRQPFRLLTKTLPSHIMQFVSKAAAGTCLSVL